MDQNLDGHLADIKWDHLKPGHILRMGSWWPKPSPGSYEIGYSIASRQWICSSFSDCVIVKCESDSRGDLWVHLARPYAYVHLSDTIAASVLTGVEEYKVLARNLIGTNSQYRIVLLASGTPHTMDLK